MKRAVWPAAGFPGIPVQAHSMPPLEKKKFRVAKIIDEARNVKTFRLAPADGGDVNAFKPGQFISVFWLKEDGSFGTDVRPYSVASSPNTRTHHDITVKMLGRFPDKLATLQEGSLVGAMGPVGLFTLDPAHTDVVFIAGGVGCAPLMSMIRFALESGNGGNYVLVMSQKTPADVVYREELERLQKAHANFRVVLTMTAPDQCPQWTGKTGRIDAALLRDVVPSFDGKHAYICGPPAMVEGVEKALVEIGVQKTHVKTEKWD